MLIRGGNQESTDLRNICPVLFYVMILRDIQQSYRKIAKPSGYYDICKWHKLFKKINSIR